MSLAAALRPTRAGALDRATSRLRAAGFEQARLEARVLLEHATGVDRRTLLMDGERSLGEGAAAAFERLLARRLGGEPIAYLVGRREFWSLDLAVGPGVLVPRPDSETVVEAALEAVPDRSAALRVLDLGTGSGCLLLALLTELPAAVGLGLDRSEAAARIARANAARVGMAERARFVVGDWDTALAGRFDLIVTNPPYIPTGEIDGLAPEVRDFEPRAALDGGADGLDAYRALAPVVACHLAPGGVAVLECGVGQADAVDALMRSAGLGAGRRRRDLAGIERALVLHAPEALWPDLRLT